MPYGLSELYSIGRSNARRGSGKPLKYVSNLILGTTCRYHMPCVAAVVEAGSRTWAMGRHHPFARAIKQCSLTIDCEWDGPKVPSFQGSVDADGRRGNPMLPLKSNSP